MNALFKSESIFTTFLQGTVDWYRQTFAWLSKFPLTEDGMKQFVIAMREAGLQPISCNSRIRCANAYLKWSGSTVRIQRLKEEIKVLPTYSEEHLRNIVTYRPTTYAQARLHTLVLTLTDTGMRVDEALSLRRSDVNLDQMLFTVMGKGGKERFVAFSFDEKPFQEKSGFMIFLKTAPLWEPLHADPRYQRMLKAVFKDS